LHLIQYLKDNQESGDRALLRGEKASAQMAVEHCEGVDISLWAPILIVVPSSLVENWTNEFKLWGHFSVAIFRGSDRCLALERVRAGMDEILICGKGLFDSSINSLNSVKWKLIVVDEFHEYKVSLYRISVCSNGGLYVL
jgi:SNF2 family DNA or RNA helicase